MAAGASSTKLLEDVEHELLPSVNAKMDEDAIEVSADGRELAPKASSDVLIAHAAKQHLHDPPLREREVQ
jgi:hypothetical protein